MAVVWMKGVSKSFSVGSKYRFSTEQGRLVTAHAKSQPAVAPCGAMESSILLDNDTLEYNNSASKRGEHHLFVVGYTGSLKGSPACTNTLSIFVAYGPRASTHGSFSPLILSVAIFLLLSGGKLLGSWGWRNDDSRDARSSRVFEVVRCRSGLLTVAHQIERLWFRQKVSGSEQS